MATVTAADSFDSLLLQASAEVLLLLDGDSLCILGANAAAAHLLGYAEDGLLGLSIGDVECALSDIFFWDEMRGKTEAANVESSLRCVDGSVIQVNKWVRQVSASPLRYTMRAVADTTQHVAQAELVNMGSRLRATLEATADGILLVDHAGSIINMNQRFSELWQFPSDLLTHRDDGGIFKHLHDQCERGDPMGSSGEGETVFLRDGRVFECAVRPATSSGELIGQVYSYRDVTERFRNQQELIAARDEAKHASEAKSAFLAMMSHEIRTPLNGVLGVAELLAATPLDPAQSDYVGVIQSSGRTLLAILNDVLDFSKIEAGKLDLERTSFAVAPLLGEIQALYLYRVHDGGPVFECVTEGDVPAAVTGDPVRLRQILFNLVGNAFKFTEQGSIRLSVSCAPEAPHRSDQVCLKFSVRDTGIGLTPDQVERLFRRFEQADSSISRKYGGTGLGLAICKRLVQMMGGEIGAKSQVGVGSEFWFTAWLGLEPRPLAAPDGPNVSPGEEAFRLSADLRVLLVEDHPVNQLVMRGILRKMGGAEPAVAENGQIGLDMAQAQPFDLVLMDMQMPVVDGLQATRQLRQRGFTAPIIGVSAGALEEERQAALDAGVDDYVHKPVNVKSLSTALRRVFEMR